MGSYSMGSSNRRRREGWMVGEKALILRTRSGWVLINCMHSEACHCLHFLLRLVFIMFGTGVCV